MTEVTVNLEVTFKKHPSYTAFDISVPVNIDLYKVCSNMKAS